MPAHVGSLANILNDEGAPDVRRPENYAPRFIAPRARVMVVDDNLTNLKVTHGFLLPHKMTVDLCESGEAAVAMARENHYDIIFMDHMMPGMDGVEATAQLRAMEKHRDTPIIALTANIVSGMKEMFLEKGMSDFLPKPVIPAQLDAILRKWIPRGKRIDSSEKPEDRLKAPYAPPIQVPGIDMDTVMKRFSGDIAAWKEVVRIYGAHTPEILNRLRVPASLFDYGVAAHSLKGSSYNICADLVGREAGELEEAAKQGNLEEVQARREPFIRHVEALLATLASLEEGNAGEDDRERRPSPDEAVLRSLLRATERYDASAMEKALGELERYGYEEGNDLVVWLRGELDALEYDHIREQLGGRLGEQPGGQPEAGA
jgi:CheY-like chemotaxis protein